MNSPATLLGIGPCPTTASEYADLINSEWRKSVEGIIGAGRWLIQAKAELEHGEFGALFELLPFTDRTGQMLMKLADSQRLTNTNHGSYLPASWRTLYELARLDEDQWAVVEPYLSPELERGQIKALLSGKPHVSHNSGNNEWYTPHDYIVGARHFLGTVDLDPASSEVANYEVGAGTYYTAEDDGLTKPWAGRVWMNPPYSSELIGKFVTKLCDHIVAGDVTAAAVLVNNATETAWFQELLRHAHHLCFPDRRIRFLNEDNEPVGSPLQGQVVLGFGGEPAAFKYAFELFRGGCGCDPMSVPFREVNRGLSGLRMAQEVGSSRPVNATSSRASHVTHPMHCTHIQGRARGCTASDAERRSPQSTSVRLRGDSRLLRRVGGWLNGLESNRTRPISVCRGKCPGPRVVEHTPRRRE